MKRERELIELSEDEWTPHSDSFKPSRVLNPNPNHPPPIESFAFSKTTSTATDSVDIHLIDTSSSDEIGAAPAANGNEFEDLEDDDAEIEVSKRPSTSARGNRFVIDDDDDDEDDDGGGDDDGDYSDHEAWMSEKEEEEDDVVKKALRKCEKISAELKQELYGTATAACHQYSEVELGSSAAARIVTQVLMFKSLIFAIQYIRVLEI